MQKLFIAIIVQRGGGLGVEVIEEKRSLGCVQGVSGFKRNWEWGTKEWSWEARRRCSFFFFFFFWAGYFSIFVDLSVGGD